MDKIQTTRLFRYALCVSIFLCILMIFYLARGRKIWSTLTNTGTCEKCNIVLIVIDPLRADALPCYGYSANTTPNICRFAQNNSLYTNTFSQSSWTLPSIMSLFSSQYPTQHNVFVPNVDVLPATMTTLPMALKAAGYRTTFIGPVTDETHHVPLDRGIGRGFDHIVPFTSLKNAAITVQHEIKNATPNKPVFVFIHSFNLRNDSVKEAPTVFPLDPNYTYGFVDPYLRSVTLTPPETKGNVSSYRRVYDERLRQLDEQFTDIIQSITDTQSDQKTVIAITSDHGEEFGEHGHSGHGINLYKNVTHVPFILSIPNQNPIQSDNLVQSIDIYPTLLGAVGISAPTSTRGINLFTKNQMQNSYAISQLEPEKRLAAIRNDTWAYYFNPNNEKTKRQGKLYNTKLDPSEIYPILSPDPKLINELIHNYEQLSTK